MLVQKMRLQRGWSQQQLADLSGLSVRTIQRIERGQGASVETLKSLASVFEIDFSALNSESPMPDPQTPGASADEILAFRYARKLRGFYIHLIQYVVVITILCVINFASGSHKVWVIWPALGWGIGILVHAASTFEVLPFLGAGWERRQVEKRLGRSL